MCSRREASSHCGDYLVVFFVEDRLNQAVVNDTDNPDVVWGILRNCLIDVSDEVCGKPKVASYTDRLGGGMMKWPRL